MKRGKKKTVTNQTQTELREIRLIERVVSPTESSHPCSKSSNKFRVRKSFVAQ